MYTLWGWGGPVVGFEHHRGITHTFAGLPVEAAVVVAGFWAWHRWRGGRRERKAAVSWGWLYGGVLVALLSHLLLDWTNNYGLRPFFPFDDRWFAGSFVFIVEPVLLVLLVAALLMPWLFGLVNAEVGERRPQFAGRGWAIAGLVGIAALYVFRYGEREKAMRIAAENGTGPATRVFASPRPLNPFAWSVVSDLGGTYQLAEVDTRREEVAATVPSDTVYKPETTNALLAAKRTFLGRVYLDWSSYPVLTEEPELDDPLHPLVRVTFSDARFMYDVSVMHGRTKPPISGTVLLDMSAPEGQRVVETKMGDRVQR